MPEYSYRAIDKYGKEKRGNITADTEDVVFSKLRADNLTPLEVKKANIFTKDVDISIGGSIKPRDLSVFCRQFISMINAGVTIVDALGMLEEQTENKKMAKAIGGAKNEIGKGETLSNALAKYPDVFPDIMVKMVAAGEASGKLEVAFERMSGHFEKSAKLKAIMKKSAMYPIMLALVALGVIVLMLTFVIPKYTEMFESLDTELPGITKAMVAASNFVIHKWYLIVLVVVAVVAAVKAFKKTEQGQVFFATVARKMPIFGNLTIKSAASNFSRTLSTLVYSGLPLIEALGITAGTMTNYLYKKKLENAKDEVVRGVPLSEPLLADDMFPPMVGHMTRIGEETGELEDMLSKLADYYDEEVEMATQTVLAALEPMIIVVLAGVVVLLIGAVMAPMLALYNGLDSM